MFVSSAQPHWKPTEPATCTTAICYLTPGRKDRGGGWSQGYACLHLVHNVTSSRLQSLSLSLSHKGARISTVRRQPCLAWRLIWTVTSWLQRVSMMLRRHTLPCPQTSLSHGHIFKCWKYQILFFPAGLVLVTSILRSEWEAADLAEVLSWDLVPLDPHRLGWCHSASYIWGDSGRHRFVFLPRTHTPLTWDRFNLTWRTFTAPLKSKEVSCREFD